MSDGKGLSHAVIVSQTPTEVLLSREDDDRKQEATSAMHLFSFISLVPYISADTDVS